MLTSFSQVAEWIRDNGFKRWVLYRDYSRTEKIVDSANFPSDIPDKLAMTEKYLRLNGGHAYAAAATSNAASDLNTIMEIQLTDVQPLNTQPTAGVGMTMENIGQIEERLRKQIKAEIAQEKYEQDRKEFEAEKKEFEQEKQSVIGLIVQQVAPYIPMLSGQRRMVAGVDTEEPVHAQPIIADDPEKKEPEQEDPFTEEEEDRMYDLMVRFKKSEPQYLELIESVVKMAESGDMMYNTAKSFLIKK